MDNPFNNDNDLAQLTKHGSITPLTSNLDSYFTTTATNTRDTTPGDGIGFGGFHTISVTDKKHVTCIKALEEAIIKFEPFRTFSCAFCNESGITCECQALATIDNNAEKLPKSKKKLIHYLEQEEIEAAHIQAATLTYLLALEKHCPFGIEFNLDQQMKCGIMNSQLEQVKHRIQDIRKAVNLLESDEDVVPGGILKSCKFLQVVLANCLGNARENHICFKLNFKLFMK